TEVRSVSLFKTGGVCFTSAFENYVNKLSIWIAYCIFCLAWVFSEMLAILLTSSFSLKVKHPKSP
ncbi:hypothetical protein OCD93_27915, partial [Bacillus toyonensis]|nr:hypothetical protein [Bacillus toyonensis]